MKNYTLEKDFSAARQHHMDFWNGTGMAMALTVLKPQVKLQGQVDLEAMHKSPQIMAKRQIENLNLLLYFCDSLPMVHADLGTVSMAQLLGCVTKYHGTIWYEPPVEDMLDSSIRPELDKANPHWNFLLETLQILKKNSPQNAVISIPPYAPGLDTLAALRGDEKFLMDLLDRPDWVHEKLKIINQLFRFVLDKTAPLTFRCGGTAFAYFHIWGEGKMSVLQCDTAASISTGMYDEFVAPYLREQCQMLDHSLYHVDGTQALRHMKSVLQIPELTAVQWSPQPGIEPGGAARWYDLYQSILDAGKRVQITGVRKNDIKPLIHELGNKGIFLNAQADSPEEAGEMEEIFNSLR